MVRLPSVLVRGDTLSAGEEGRTGTVDGGVVMDTEGNKEINIK